MQPTTQDNPAVPGMESIPDRTRYADRADAHFSELRQRLDRMGRDGKAERLSRDIRTKLAAARPTLDAIRNFRDQRWEDSKRAYEAAISEIELLLQRASGPPQH